MKERAAGNSAAGKRYHGRHAPDGVAYGFTTIATLLDYGSLLGVGTEILV